MDFAGIAWWAYLLAGIAGVVLGGAQSLLMKRAVLTGKSGKGLYVLKYVIWVAAILGMGLISLPLMVVFVATGSVTMLVVSFLLYRGIRKGER
jgi:hypothetical protein